MLFFFASRSPAHSGYAEGTYTVMNITLLIAVVLYIFFILSFIPELVIKEETSQYLHTSFGSHCHQPLHT